MHGLLVLHRVRPHQVTEDPVKRNLLLAVNLVNLIEHLKARRDATVHGQVLARDITGDGHGIEYFHEEVVDFDVEALQDFVAERERLGHVSRLVVPPEHHHVAREVLLDREQQNAHLDPKDPPIHVVAQEEVIQ